MSELRPRGLGRGLSALLGEPVRTETPPAANTHARPEPKPEAPSAPVQPPRNVFELPVTSPPAAQTPPPQTPPVSAGAQPQSAASDGPKALPIDLVQRNPQQPRKHFDENELNELASSIRTHGVLQPILVRPIGGGKHEIAVGARRSARACIRSPPSCASSTRSKFSRLP